MQQKIDLESNGFYDLDCSWLPGELLSAAERCIEQQKTAAQAAHESVQSVERPLEFVSPDALEKILVSGQDVHGVASDRSISDVIVFGAHHIEDSVLSEAVSTSRREVDNRLSRELASIFATRKPLNIVSSGHLWYPKGSYMGWHTNNRAPGWRIYINYAEEPGKSFFRYRDPDTGQITTSWDKRWNLRVFRIDERKPIWHCVYSDTNRFSLGYMLKVQKQRNFFRFARKLKR